MNDSNDTKTKITNISERIENKWKEKMSGDG